jgi:hypothetical protein
MGFAHRKLKLQNWEEIQKHFFMLDDPPRNPADQAADMAAEEVHYQCFICRSTGWRCMP